MPQIQSADRLPQPTIQEFHSNLISFEPFSAIPWMYLIRVRAPFALATGNPWQWESHPHLPACGMACVMEKC
ncbi:hypothetical protein QCA50_013755 [Cerrena zonata]|uniref:Uncharacterized protein n=1 Tax=Cerrena zonata TaxID=2478898 RepID=A0AAW0G0J3_9APHY